MTELAKKSLSEVAGPDFIEKLLFLNLQNILWLNRWLRASQKDGSKILEMDQLSRSYWTSASICCSVHVCTTRITTGMCVSLGIQRFLIYFMLTCCLKL